MIPSTPASPSASIFDKRRKTFDKLKKKREKNAAKLEARLLEDKAKQLARLKRMQHIILKGLIKDFSEGATTCKVSALNFFLGSWNVIDCNEVYDLFFKQGLEVTHALGSSGRYFYCSSDKISEWLESLDEETFKKLKIKA